MTTPCDIVAFVEEIKGWQINREEGVQCGRWDRTVHGATVCWKATLDIIEQAGRRGDDLIIGHESLYDPYDFDFNAFVRPGWQSWSLNERRRQLLSRYHLGYLRLHSSVDELFVRDGFAGLLGLGAATKAENGATVWDYGGGTLADLIAHVKSCSGLQALRVCAPRGMDQPVHRIGLLIGGAGLDSNVGAQESLVAGGCDVLISGESDNYGFRYAQECGVATIETSHEVSEIPGLRMFSAALQKHFVDIRFTFCANSCPYVIV